MENKPDLDSLPQKALRSWAAENPPTGTAGEQEYTSIPDLVAYILYSVGGEAVDHQWLMQELGSMHYRTVPMGSVLHVVHY